VVIAGRVLPYSNPGVHSGYIAPTAYDKHRINIPYPQMDVQVLINLSLPHPHLLQEFS